MTETFSSKKSCHIDNLVRINISGDRSEKNIQNYIIIMKKEKKTFRPIITPRYLIGAVPKIAAMEDLKIYNLHRRKIFAAVPVIDTKPPKINPHNYLNERKLTSDTKRLLQIERENKEIVRKINIINRTIGVINSYNPRAYHNTSRWKAHENQMLTMVKDNKKIYKCVTFAKPMYSCERYRKDWKRTLEIMNIIAKFPAATLYKDNLDKLVAKLPSISSFSEPDANLYRPKCFMDFKMTNGQFLGRMIIELYDDYVPVTVQNFQTLCVGEKEGLSYENCPIHKIIPGKYVELGDITKGCGKGGASIYGENFAEESLNLKLTKPGVLSMVRVGKKENNSLFRISFTAIEELNEKCVVFGKVIKGIDTLFKIEGMGRKFGKPMPIIYVQQCGECKLKKKI